MTLARTQQPELLDSLAEHATAGEVVGNLRDIRLANRWLGGTRATLNAVRPWLSTSHREAPVSILDVATGSADIPVAIADWSRRSGLHVRIVATDVQPDVLAIARAAERPGQIIIEQADACELPYPSGSFDLVTLSLALHHFEPEGAMRVLREMRRVARSRMVVNDLDRSRMGYAGAWLVAHLLTTNRLTRNDAPLSVRRAYTRREALALAHAAGWHGATVRGVVPFRLLLTGRPE